MKGQIKISDDFNDPLPDSMMQSFEESDDDLL